MKVNVRYIKTGKVKSMKKVFADILIKNRVVEIIPEGVHRHVQVKKEFIPVKENEVVSVEIEKEFQDRSSENEVSKVQEDSESEIQKPKRQRSKKAETE